MTLVVLPLKWFTWLIKAIERNVEWSDVLRGVLCCVGCCVAWSVVLSGVVCCSPLSSLLLRWQQPHCSGNSPTALATAPLRWQQPHCGGNSPNALATAPLP